MQIKLRFPEPGDAQAIFEAVQESMDDLHRWMPWCRPGYSLFDAKQWITAQTGARSTGVAFEFVVCNENKLFLGCCGLSEINKSYRMANLGYWVRSSQSGQGIATEAAKKSAAWAFANTDLQRLEIVTAVGNIASQHVALKLGAQREGVLRSRILIHGVFHDAVMHSLIRPEEGKIM